ncbi:Uncharacterised protein [Vibrio cholerae]|nr:Uncharacterised protein [Vibrio cholerae]CSA36252.1 Uncharacterised protein [Vibrio cholerae]
MVADPSSGYPSLLAESGVRHFVITQSKQLVDNRIHNGLNRHFSIFFTTLRHGQALF